MRRRHLLGAGLAVAVAGMAGTAMAQSEIKIGEINSYSLLPAFTEPYRKGWQLAVEEINAAGGINGKKLVVVSKDDGGKPADAQTAANELVSSENVAMLTGTFLSNIGLAVTDFANQKKVFFLAAEPLTDAITWSKGNRYTFRLRPSNYMQAAMLVEEAAKLPAKRWATIAPNYEYGQSAVAVFKKLMSEKRPDIQWVDEQWPPQGKIDAGPVVQAVAAANPEAILNVTFGADLVKLVREGNTRGLFKDRAVVSLPHRRAGISRSAEGGDAGRLDRHRLSLVRHQDAGARQVPESLSGQVQRLSAARLDRRLPDHQGGRGDPRQGQLDRSGEADRGDRRPVDAVAVRRDHLPQDRPPVDARRLRRQDRAEGRQGRDGGFGLSQGRGLSAERRRSRKAASEGLRSSLLPLPVLRGEGRGEGLSPRS